MAKQPKSKNKTPLGTDMVPYTPQPGVLEVVIHTYGDEPPIYGHCTKDSIVLGDKAVFVKWADGGYTYVPNDSVIKVHWEEIPYH